MLNFQGTVYIRNGITYSLPLIGGSIFLVNPGSVLIINQQYNTRIADSNEIENRAGRAGAANHQNKKSR